MAMECLGGRLCSASANNVPLTPIDFLERAAHVYGDATSIIYGTVRFSWRQTHQICLKLASALAQLKISRGDIVSFIFPHLHFAISTLYA